MADLGRRWRSLPRQNQIVIIVCAGIATGVLLIGTGIALLQLAGALVVVIALVTARSSRRLTPEQLDHPQAAWNLLTSEVGRRTPGWVWPLAVAALVAVLGVIMIARVVTGEDLDRNMVENLLKGVIALGMIGTLALWNVDRFEIRRLWRGRKNAADSPEQPIG